MALFGKIQYSSSGKRLTGFPRYTEVLERNFKQFMFTNLLTIIGFLPFAAGVLLAILSSSVLVLVPACVIGGLFAGPALSCMQDVTLRALRDVSGKCWPTWKRALKQNWKQSLLPGVVLCLLLGFYLFMAMLFWWSSRFPGWGTIAIYLAGMLVCSTFFSVFWPHVVLFDQPVKQRAVNCLIFILMFLLRSLAVGALQMLYWLVMALILPWSVMLMPFIGFWFIIYSVNFLLYDTLNEYFQIEKRISEAFPEQAPFYEDDEAWLKRKQEETGTVADDKH